jgi:hypothetical protein
VDYVRIPTGCKGIEILCDGGKSLEEAYMAATGLEALSVDGSLSKETGEKFEEEHGLGSLDIIELSMLAEDCVACTVGSGDKVCALGDAVVKLSA